MPLIDERVKFQHESSVFHFPLINVNENIHQYAVRMFVNGMSGFFVKSDSNQTFICSLILQHSC